MDNVIQFPKRNDVKNNMDDDFDIEDIIYYLMQDISEMMDEYGFIERDELNAKDFYYMMEAVRSFVYRQVDEEHFFQSIAEEVVDSEVRDGVYFVWWKKTDENGEEE